MIDNESSKTTKFLVILLIFLIFELRFCKLSEISFNSSKSSVFKFKYLDSEFIPELTEGFKYIAIKFFKFFIYFEYNSRVIEENCNLDFM